MEIEKKVIGSIPKCYAAAPLYYRGKEHFLVSAERSRCCVLYDLEGKEEDVIRWDSGGVMTMQQIPGTDGQFLATQGFFSPHDAENAGIVIVTPAGKKEWEIRTLLDLPYVHRFGILERNREKYLIACTVKSGQKQEGDWSCPGKVYAARLPEDFGSFDKEHQFRMEVIMDGMIKNHGYTVKREKGMDQAIISCENGVYRFIPPREKGDEWEITQLLELPASDAVLVDLDGDGVDELAVISPFHGDCICIYRQEEGGFQKVYQYEKAAEFSHAIFGGRLNKIPVVVIGHREGERNLLLFYWEKERGQFRAELLDKNCGSANVLTFSFEGEDYLVSANREIDEAALYKIKW